MSEIAFPIPTTYSRIIARMLGLQERELPRLLQGTGLSTDILLPGDGSYMSGEQQLRILENGRRLMGSPNFGLAVGQQLQPSTHGPLGYLALSSPDLRSSLEALSDYLPVRLPMVKIEVRLQDAWLLCSYRVLLDTEPYTRRILAETFSTVVQAQVEAVLGREVQEARVEFEHSEPSDGVDYGHYLHSPCCFGCDAVAYRLPAQLAHEPNLAGDTEAYRVARDLCTRLLAQTPASARSVADRVRTLLLTQPQENVREEDVARAMFVSKRTLARRLQAEGTGYRQIRDQVLLQLAQQALNHSNQSVDTIAASLGYFDSAAFRKAFKRWTGTTPQAFRRQQQT